MRVLVVSAHFPEQPAQSISGSFQRFRTWLDAIQSSGAELDVLFFPQSHVTSGPEAEARAAERLASDWGVRAKVTLCPREPSEDGPGLLERYVLPALALRWHNDFRMFAGPRQQAALAGCLSRLPDAVLFFHLQGTAAGWVTDRRRRIYLDLDDIEYRKYLREIWQPPRRPLKPLRLLWVPALWWGERLAIARSERSFVCSDSDRSHVARSMGVRNVAVIPNSATHFEDRPLSTEPNLLFVGTYGYAPNRVAAEYLVREVWPRLSRMRPEARLLIAGPRAEEIPSYHRPPAGVEFLGFVPDLEALYAKTRLVCCPIQSGGGTRVKILEAAGHGIPVVSTPLGAEGLDLKPDWEILLRQTADEMAAACAELLSDHERAESLGARGRDRVRALYGREVVMARMREFLLLDGKRPSG